MDNLIKNIFSFRSLFLITFVVLVIVFCAFFKGYIDTISFDKRILTVYEAFSFGVSFLTLLVYTFTLFAIWYQIHKDHERRRKQATIEHIESVKSIYRNTNHWLEDVHGDILDMKKLSPEDIKGLKDMLSVVEHMSTGVLTGVFDLQLIERMSGSFFQRLHKRVLPFIESVRNTKNNQKIYADFSELIDEIDKIRKQGRYLAKNKNGKI